MGMAGAGNIVGDAALCLMGGVIGSPTVAVAAGAGAIINIAWVSSKVFGLPPERVNAVQRLGFLSLPAVGIAYMIGGTDWPVIGGTAVDKGLIAMGALVTLGGIAGALKQPIHILGLTIAQQTAAFGLFAASTAMLAASVWHQPTVPGVISVLAFAFANVCGGISRYLPTPR